MPFLIPENDVYAHPRLYSGFLQVFSCLCTLQGCHSQYCRDVNSMRRVRNSLCAEESRKLLMREVLQRCYPTHLVLRQAKPTTGNAPAAWKSTDADTRSGPSPKHPGLAFVDQPTLQPENRLAEPHTLRTEHVAAAAAELAPANSVEPASDCTDADQTCQEFSACLCSTAWKASFDVANVTSEQICEASAVLMSHWQSAIEGASHHTFLTRHQVINLHSTCCVCTANVCLFSWYQYCCKLRSDRV